MADKLSAEQIRENLKMQQDILVGFLKTESGKQALEFLQKKYGGDVFEVDTNKTLVRIGERRVVDYLTELREGK